MASSAQHSKATVRWGSTADIVERGRRVMGGIDTDPCSEAQFNEIVKATTYYSLLERGEDGLKLPWIGNVWCNPPGGLVRQFWLKALAERRPTIWVGFSVEQLCLLADIYPHPLDFATCLVRKRIKFKHHEDPEKERPTHSNYITGLYLTSYTKFAEEFTPLGKIVYGNLADPVNLP